ncbi:septin-1-like isoform X2 [Ostrinia furnacalis]|nr:septin-1-like isoform X1 [Ostrinia furnacalis]XP_028157681.1 septin-1-like isoform X2 [Ostrinia furnacalis]
MLITHMQDLQEVTQEVHYENYRSERLARSGQVPKRHTSTESGLSEADSNGVTNGSNEDADRALREKEAELRRMQEMLEQMQRQMQLAAAGAPTTA